MQTDIFKLVIPSGTDDRISFSLINIFLVNKITPLLLFPESLLNRKNSGEVNNRTDTTTKKILHI